MNGSYERALLLHHQRRYADAEREFKQVLVADPHNADAHAMLALCLVEQKRLPEATAEADAAVGLAPHVAFGHYARARVMSERQRFDEAEIAVGEALRLNSFEPDYYSMLAGIRMSRRRWADALEAAESGLSIDPQHAGCVNLRAIALVQLGRKAEAAQTIDAALSRDPHNAVTHANQGWALLHQGQHRQALEHFREALRINPELDWARAGMVEALKARHLIYRLMLRYFLWMSRLNRRAQWGLVLGAYLAYQVLIWVGRADPQLRPIVWPLAIGYVVFVYLTWIAMPLFDLLLRLNRFGRHALSRDQRVASNGIGIILLGALVSLGIFLGARREEAGLAALYLAVLVLPVAAVFRSERGWPRAIMAAGSAALALLAACAVYAFHVGRANSAWLDLAQSLGTAYLVGVFLLVWVFNGLAFVKVRR